MGIRYAWALGKRHAGNPSRQGLGRRVLEFPIILCRKTAMLVDKEVE